MNGGRIHRARGFTLLELLVSVTVVALLATTLLFAWRIASSAWGRASEVLAENRHLEAVQQLLQQQMAGMVPLRLQSEIAPGEVFFQGEQRLARFISRYSLENRSRSGFSRVEYLLEPQPDGTSQLLLNEVALRQVAELTPLVLSIDQTEAGRRLQFAPFQKTVNTLLLAEGLRGAKFQYFWIDPTTGQGEWLDQWISRGVELPRAMALRLMPAAFHDVGERPRTSPSLIAEIPGYLRSAR